VLKEFANSTREPLSVLEFGTADGYSFIKLLYATRHLANPGVGESTAMSGVLSDDCGVPFMHLWAAPLSQTPAAAP
jgi:hypothetical protein